MLRSNWFRILILIALSTLFACCLFPLVWRLVDQVFSMDYEPGRVYRRIWMITVLLGLLLWRKKIGLQRPAEAGYDQSWSSRWNTFVGIAVVWGFLSILSGFYLLIGGWKLDPGFSLTEFLKRFAEGFPRGTIVALLEEYIFRGLIFLAFCRRWGWLRAAFLSSLIFSSLHFLTGTGIKEVADPYPWTAGFTVCSQLVTNMAIEFRLFPDAVGLFLVGFILCYAFYRTGSLWYAVGLHGGWVWFASFITAFVDETYKIDPFYLGGNRLYEGLFPLIGMTIIFPVTCWLISTKRLTIKPLFKKN